MATMQQPVSDVTLAEPRGFCAGVDRAIEIDERALKRFGAPIYVRHEIVHNTYVVNDLKAKGAIFIEDLADVPPGATLVFSAHGVSQAVRKEAAARGFSVFDATCPLVTKVHVEVAKLHKEGFDFIMIGHKGHPEVEGTMGQVGAPVVLPAVLPVARHVPSDDQLLAMGVDASPERIIGKALEVDADIIAMSALLTTTMVKQREVIDELEKEGLRSRFKVIVGGAPVTRDWVQRIAADGFSEDAIGAVNLARQLVAEA